MVELNQESNQINNLDEIIYVWEKYLNELNDWKILIKDAKPKITGNGEIYGLKNPINRPNESFAIADMRKISFAEPHYHPETEIYFILQGSGKVVIGGKEEVVQKSSIVIIPSNIAHFTIPKNDLVLAVINTPPFKMENYFALSENNKTVKFDKNQFDRLICH